MKKILLLSSLSFILVSHNVNAQNFAWAKAMGGSFDDNAYSIAVDASGNVYTTGFFRDTVDFDPGAGVFNLISAGGWDIFISKLDADGNFVWTKAMGGRSNDQVNSMALDALGNIYTTGIFGDTADFDPGVGVFNLSPLGGWTTFISKLDASGNFVWAKAMSATNSIGSYCIAVDDSGNVYNTGIFDGTADFDPDTGIFNLTSAGVDAIFISKLDASGNFVWAKAIGANGPDYGRAITVDDADNIYTTGYFSDTVDFDPGAGVFNLISSTGYDMFVSKSDASGNFIWAKAIGGATGGEISSSIAVDASGNIYTSGYFTGTSDFDPDSSGNFNLTSAGSFDIFISKLDASGNFVWAKAIGGAGDDRSYSIALDALDNVYTTSHFYGTVDFDPGVGVFNLISAGSSDIFISILNTSGNFVNAKSMSGTGIDVSFSIAVDASGSIYTTGSFQDTVDFDPDAGVFNLTSVGSWDIFISKLSSTVGINQVSATPQSLNISPNPTHDELVVTSSELGDGAELKVVDFLGREIFSVTLTGVEARNLNLQTSNLTAGIYFIRLQSDAGVLTKKFVVSH